MLAHSHPGVIFHDSDFNVRKALSAAFMRTREAICALGGHEYLQHSTANRIFLECTTCGHETSGWRIDVAPRLKRTTRHA